jgi:hypothetical protein
MSPFHQPLVAVGPVADPAAIDEEPADGLPPRYGAVVMVAEDDADPASVSIPVVDLFWDRFQLRHRVIDLYGTGGQASRSADEAITGTASPCSGIELEETGSADALSISRTSIGSG